MADETTNTPVAAPVQLACDRCTQGVMDSTNPHLLGTCACPCHQDPTQRVEATCECYGDPEGTPLCDECLAEERERDLERADRLFEEEVYLYGI